MYIYKYLHIYIHTYIHTYIQTYIHTYVPKGKGKGHPRTDYEGPEGEQMYNSTLSLTSALDGVGGQRRAPATLPRYSLYRRLGGAQGRSGRISKISPCTEILSADLPARSESLYRLSYPGSLYIRTKFANSLSRYELYNSWF